MRSIINYSDLNRRKGFNDLVSLIQTDQTKIKYLDRTAPHELNERINRRKQMMQMARKLQQSQLKRSQNYAKKF